MARSKSEGAKEVRVWVSGAGLGVRGRIPTLHTQLHP